MLTGLALCGIIFAWGASKEIMRALGASEVRANKFILVDNDGNERGELGFDENGPHLVLFDADDKARVVVAIEKDTPGLVLFDADGNAVWSAP